MATCAKDNDSMKSIKNNGSIKSNKYGRICFVRKWKLLKTNSANQLRKPVKLFEFIAHNNTYTSFPNLFITLRIYMTIPATVASRKSFSKLKQE